MPVSNPFEPLLTYSSLNHILVISFIGYSKSGKTASIERLIEYSIDQGFRVMVMKNTDHTRPIFDTPGKNTWKFAQKGAQIIMAKSQVEAVSFLNWNLGESDFTQYMIHQLEFLSRIHPLQKIILLCEGFRNLQINQILCATNSDDLEKQLSPSIVAITGRITCDKELKQEFEKSARIPFINCLDHPERLLDLCLSKI